MNPTVLEWSGLLVRWFHMIAGIWWIGSSLYFVWLDNSFEPPKESREGVEGETFMVHGGFYYLVEKRLMQPGKMPETLHWFKWEATFTWISGMLLLTVVYYLTGGAYLVDPQVANITTGTAVAISLATVFLSWLIYDTLWQTLGKKSVPAGTAISLAMLLGLAYGLCHTFSGRAAYIHMGAILGTIMVANVWIRILPGQQKMLDDAMAGKTPDYSQGKWAKVRSVHNSYMTFPVLFMMISNHYAQTFGNQENWVVLILLMVFGAGIRHYMITHEQHRPANWVWAPVAAALAVLIWMTAPQKPAAATTDGGEQVHFSQVQAIISVRCLQCHSSSPSDDVFKTAPNGVTFETPEQIRKMADRIKVRAVDSKAMPLGNKTNMTDEEREILGRWLAQGAP
ncbi:MAG: urate hydroxylase PuuD [Candidatus Eremiobacteraeota bacterium]|nr:urate hydroxylase PuuD [Candidatus Eremiobacteraeota bacterium]